MTIAGGGTFDMTNGMQSLASLTSTDGNGSQVLLGNSGNLTVTVPTSATFDGVISGNGGAVGMYGPGAWILTGSNTYTGGTTVGSGTLQLGDGVSHNGSVAGNIMNNSAPFSPVPSARPTTASSAATARSPRPAAGALLLTATQTYAGATFVNSGVLRLGAFVPGPSLSGLANTSATGVNSTITNGTWSFTTNGGGYTTTPLTGGTLTLTDNVGGEAQRNFGNQVPAGASPPVLFTKMLPSRIEPSRRDRGDAPKRQPRSQRVGRRWRSTRVHQRQRRNADRPSVALLLNIYSGAANGGVGTAVAENGATGLYLYCTRIGEPGERRSDSGQSSYDGSSTLTVTFSDSVANTSSGTSVAIGSIASIVGPSAYLGFSGAMGGAELTQTISNFNYSRCAPQCRRHRAGDRADHRQRRHGGPQRRPQDGRLACRLGAPSPTAPPRRPRSPSAVPVRARLAARSATDLGRSL